MIVDDNPANLKLAGDLLELEGYEVIRCIDAEKALDALDKEHPVLILMDVALPGMDGLELTQVLKADQKTKGIKIVALTAFAMKGDKEKVIAAGCDGYITKPINTRQFVQQVKEYLNIELAEEKHNPVLLLVDDNLTSLKLLKAVYETEGYETLTALNGVEALQVLSEQKTDLIITDVLMPYMDGYQLCHEIRSNEQLKDIPIIVYTATYTSLGEEAVAKEMGADLFIRKPALTDILISSVKDILGSPVKPKRLLSIPKATQIMHQYNAELIGQLEKRSIELEETKERLELTLNRFSQAQKIAHLGHGESNLITGKTIWSEEAYNILGLEPYSIEPSADTFLKYVHPEEVENVRTIFSQSRQTLSPFSFNCRIIKVGGNLRHLFFRGGFEFDKTGKPIRVYGTTMDVTELVEKEEKLREVNEALELTLKRFSQAQRIAHLGHWELNLKTQAVIWSDEVFHILGLEINAIEPSLDNFISFIYPDDLAQVNAVLEQSMQTLSPYSLSHRIVQANGNLKHLFTTGEFEFDKLGNPIQFYGTVLDITKLVEKEEKLKEVNAELELFIYKSSHDLKGPIATLQGLIALAKMELIEEDVLQYINNIEAVTHKLKTTISQLLKIMHLRKRTSAIGTINMEELVDEIMESFKYMGNYNKIKFNVVNNQTVPIKSDRDLLFTALSNLVENAIKYQKEKHAEPEINIKITTDEQHRTALIEVMDNGIGIPTAAKEKVFDMFYRATEKSEGAGLGLYLVKNAIERAKGSIEVLSEEGEGTTFKIKLPCELQEVS